MLRRLKQLTKVGTEARNRRRQQGLMPYLVDEFNFMHRDSLQAHSGFYKKLETRSIFIHDITIHYFMLQCTVIYRCWTESFHPIIFFSAINNCNDSPCLNNGTCNHLQDGFRCDCAEGFIGIICRGDSVLISFQLWNIKERLTFRVFEPTDKTTTFDRPLLRTWCSH